MAKILEKVKRIKLLILFIVISNALGISVANACGGWDYEPDYFAFNLMGHIYDKTETMLAHDYSFENGNGGENSVTDQENVIAWQNYLGENIELKDIAQFVYYSKLEDLLLFSKGKLEDTDNSIPKSIQEYLKNQKTDELLNYMIYAKQCQKVADFDYYDWYYEIEYNNDAIDSLIESGTALWASTKSKEIKLRYGYQLVRLAHYGNKLPLALKFFNEYVSRFKEQHIIYQYAYEQLGGAYKKMGRLSKAVYIFSRVYDNCKSRRPIARRSFSFSFWDNVHDSILDKAISLAKNKKEEIVLRVLFGLEKGRFTLDNVIALYQADPKNELITWFLFNALHAKENQYNSKGNPFEDVKVEGDVSDYRAFVEKVISDKKRDDIYYFQLMHAHLDYWEKDYNSANKYLDLIKGHSKIGEEAKYLTLAIELAQLESIDEKTEKFFFYNYANSGPLARNEEMKSLWLTTFQYLYSQQKDTAKAFFCFRNTNEFRNDFHNDVMNSVLRYLEKKEGFTDFEKYLIGNIDDQKADLLEAIGTDYFEMNRLRIAKEYYEKLVAATTHLARYDPFDIYYNGEGKDVFYSRANDWDDGVDGVSLLDEQFFKAYPELVVKVKTKLDLVNQMIVLKQGARDSSDGKKRAICNLILGNVWYNLSGHGAQRAILNYTNNWNTQYGQREYYGYYGYASSTDYYYSDVNNAIDCYNRVFDENTTNEIKIRAAFGLAKCKGAEIAMGRGDSYYNYDRYENPFIKKFEDLPNPIEAYSTTAYYQEVIAECGYYNSYITNK